MMTHASGNRLPRSGQLLWVQFKPGAIQVSLKPAATHSSQFAISVMSVLNPSSVALIEQPAEGLHPQQLHMLTPPIPSENACRARRPHLPWWQASGSYLSYPADD